MKYAVFEIQVNNVLYSLNTWLVSHKSKFNLIQFDLI